jgi:hypothetical protein
MTTFRARIGELDRHLKGHQEDEAEQLAVGRTRKFAQQVSGHAARTAQLVPSVAELRRADIVVELPAALQLLPVAIEEARAAALDDGLAPGRADEPAVVQFARATADEVKAAVAPAWQALKQQDFPPSIDPDLLSLVAEDEPELEQRYEFAATAVLRLSERTEPGVGDVEEWRRRVAELREIARRVTAAAPSEEVRSFLTAASSPQGAPLTSMDSNDVRQWLGDGDRSARFRIVARGR